MIADLEPPYVLIKPVASEHEFYALQGEDSDWELLDGRLVMSPASNRHEDLFRFLMIVLGGFLDERGGGVLRGSRFPMRLDERWSPEPDLMVVRQENAGRIGEQRLEGPADWVVEIVSASDLRFEEREKLPRYREAKIPEIWLIDPFAETVRVETLTATGYRTSILGEGRLASSLVSDFWIEIGWLWRQPLPSTQACLREILA